MKKLAGSVLSIFIALTLFLVAPPPSSAGGRSHGYAGGKAGGGHYGYKGGHRGRGYRVYNIGHAGRGYRGYRGGYGRWGYHRRAWGPRWGVNFNWSGPLWWGPWSAPFGFYTPPPVIVQQQPPVFVQPEQQQTDYWYYCQNPQGYYPYIKSCPGGWMRVVPETTPPNP